MRGVTRVGHNLWIAVLVLVAAFVSPTLARDLPGERESLVGLEGVYVLVEEMSSREEQAGLARSTLQTDVEVKLRQTGIRVLTETEGLVAPGSPFLHLHVKTVGLGEERLFYGIVIRLQLVQAVVLARNRTIGLHAPTWESSGVGVTGAKLLYRMRENVRDQVDEFINAYLAANPKR